MERSRLRFKPAAAAGLVLLVLASPAAAARLLYLELQAVGGYSFSDSTVLWRSGDAEEVMQKPGLGLDYLERLASEFGDWGILAAQGRLVYEPTAPSRVQGQLYSLYFHEKTPWIDVWFGHHPSAWGLSSVLDSHNELLPNLSMHGFGLDRDWGAGVVARFEHGEIDAALTTGSGMPLVFNGNRLLAARGFWGVPEADNYSFGASLAWGRVPETLGYEVVDAEPGELLLAGADVSYWWDNWSVRAEGFGGRERGEPAGAAFVRLGADWLPDNSLKTEVQVMRVLRTGMEATTWSAGLTSALTPDWTARALASVTPDMDDRRLVLSFTGLLRWL